MVVEGLKIVVRTKMRTYFRGGIAASNVGVLEVLQKLHICKFFAKKRRKSPRRAIFHFVLCTLYFVPYLNLP